MFAGGTKKKDKKIVNSIFNMNQILDDNNQEKSNNINNINNNNLSSKNNNSLSNNTSNTTNSNSLHSNESQNNNENDFFGFENIELPKEEDFGDFRVISYSDFKENPSEKEPSIKLRSKCNNKNYDLINLIIRNKTSKLKKKR
jgi:hypothetical protein